MLQSISGTYENGIVQLTEIPLNVRSSKVIVTFLDSIDTNPMNQFITLGMFSGTRQSTAEDFKIAEFQGDLDDSLD
ncbi:hypothetical protein [Chamaesiphon sp. OTE_75_metabat_556]|uniref:hypothetical protein n=1 Tax=Chamaesiphon sp. OTE_75_metabat_556 TaxID=2964692 RepID=UPI00286BD337|nr:hypothetical protein [Chamaesiphon sp. OTE_75_metabat_556]